MTEFLTQHQQRIERYMESVLPTNSTVPSTLHDAMRYSVLGGGKRVRGNLVYAAANAVNVDANAVDAAAAAVELIHAYSLVHDDMPCMDNDELRRGKKTCHIAYNEETALLVGDSLQALASWVIARENTHITPKRQLQMVARLAYASGSMGMAGGQAIDLEAVGKKLDIEALENMHRMKTGALIEVSVELGALASEKISTQQYDALRQFAQKIGLAFQVQDDVLDVESSTELLGKPQGSDEHQNKPTFPSILGLEASKQKAASLYNEALNCLKDFDEKADPLRILAKFIVRRNS